MVPDSIKLWFSAQHYQPAGAIHPALYLLKPFQWAYGWLVQARLLMYRLRCLKPYRPPVPVISIGNLTTGGTGKTPIVITLAKGLIAAGKTVVILSRGYGAEQPVAYARALDPCHGDEAYLIQEQVPEAIVIVGKNRVETLQRAIRDYRPDYVILDDGFQYLKLARDLNILLIDGHLLLGNEELLPLGPLREPISELSRADLVFITKSLAPDGMAKVDQWMHRYPSNPEKEHLPLDPSATPAMTVLTVPFQPTGLKLAQIELGKHKGKADAPILELVYEDQSVIAFSGIAQPDQFESDLQSLGLNVLAHMRYADHHCYTEADMAHITALFHQWEAKNPILVTTDKDLTKLRRLLPSSLAAKLYTLQLQPALDGLWFYDEFLTQLPNKPSIRHGHAQSRSY